MGCHSQEKLEALARRVGMIGMAVGVTLLLALAIRFTAMSISSDEKFDPRSLTEFFHYGSMALAVLLLGIPEDLPSKVTVALGFWGKAMNKGNVLIRHLSAVETMGEVTTICTSKTGVLTEDRLKVTSCWMGGRLF